MHPPAFAFSFLTFEKSAYYDRGQVDRWFRVSSSTINVVSCAKCALHRNKEIYKRGRKAYRWGREETDRPTIPPSPRYCLELKEVETGSAYRPIKISAIHLRTMSIHFFFRSNSWWHIMHQRYIEHNSFFVCQAYDNLKNVSCAKHWIIE